MHVFLGVFILRSLCYILHAMVRSELYVCMCLRLSTRRAYSSIDPASNDDRFFPSFTCEKIMRALESVVLCIFNADFARRRLRKIFNILIIKRNGMPYPNAICQSLCVIFFYRILGQSDDDDETHVWCPLPTTMPQVPIRVVISSSTASRADTLMQLSRSIFSSYFLVPTNTNTSKWKISQE